MALSDYDQNLEEDETKNRLSEALDLFEDIVNDSGFKKKNVLLFYNKKDIFDEKIQRVNLKVCPEFEDLKDEDGLDQKKAEEAIKKKFNSRTNKTGPSSGRKIFEHVTCATDTKQIKKGKLLDLLIF
jgi:uncharacterized protein YutD